MGISPYSFESIMGLVGSTGKKRPRGLELEEKEDSDREEKELEDDNVEEISPRRLTSCARPVTSATIYKIDTTGVFICFPVQKKDTDHISLHLRNIFQARNPFGCHNQSSRSEH